MVALVWAIAVAVFLTATGALDTDAAEWGARTLYWTLSVGFGLMATLAGWHLGRRFGLPDVPVATAGVLGWLLPLTAGALALCIAMFGGVWTPARFVALMPTVAAMLVVLQLPLLLVARKREAPVRPEAGCAASSTTADWLPAPYRDAKLYALEAQDHYVQVYTSRGPILVRKRFADAVASAAVSEEAGVRAHRSWWISREAIVRLDKHRGRRTVLLVNGLRVPISRSCSEPIATTLSSAASNI